MPAKLAREVFGGLAVAMVASRGGGRWGHWRQGWRRWRGSASRRRFHHFVGVGRRTWALGALKARMEEVGRECKPQEVANTLWAYATMGMKPGGRAMGALEARVGGGRGKTDEGGV